MKKMNFGDRTQYAFWGNVDYPTNKDALKARNKAAAELRAFGVTVRVWSLAGQMRKYDGLGQPNGTIGTVYYLEAKI